MRDCLLSFPGVNFLVTGGAGFIGSNLCERLLLSGHSVWAFDDLNNFYDPKFKQRNLQLKCFDRREY